MNQLLFSKYFFKLLGCNVNENDTNFNMEERELLDIHYSYGGYSGVKNTVFYRKWENFCDYLIKMVVMKKK